MAKKPRKKPAGKTRKRRKSPPSPAVHPPPVFDRRAMEQQMAAVTRLLQEREFGSIEEANAFIQDIASSGSLVAATSDAAAHVTPLEQAQDLMYEAWQSSGRKRVDLARRALSISPDCADACVLLAEETATSPESARELYEQGVRAGERALGPETFEEDAGHFWGMLETRPYMRARAGLAECLWALGERDDAIAHARDMLRLNPGDNQGIRYRLLDWLLAEQRGDAGELLELFPDDGAAVWLYGRALNLYVMHGESAAANATLREALAANGHVPAYLLGSRKLPRLLPAFIELGGESEAVEYAAAGAGLWRSVPAACDWLRRSWEDESS